MEENEKLHKIRVEIEKAKQEKQQEERQLVRAENRLKYRENMSSMTITESHMEQGWKIYRDSVSLPGLLMLLTSCYLTGVEIVDFYLLCAMHPKQRYIFWKMKQNPVFTLNRCGRR